MENNCKWFFDEQKARGKGVNDPLEENFKAHPYYSIVRESIQNSLDAVRDIEKPVIIEFNFDEINRNEYPFLINGLEQHILWCQEFWKNDENAKNKFKEMINYMNGKIEGKKRLKIPILKISDFNTIGMTYTKDDPSASFNAFLRYEGNSSKNDTGSGGSFGFGKAAYFNLSPFRTILVSTKNLKNDIVFEGATVLATHKNPETDEKLTAYGFYNCEGEVPVTNIERVPEFFRRKEIGTDVYIIGLWNDRNRKKEMIKSVLNNFWLAIHRKKLIVKIEDIEINSKTLTDLINKYYPSENESGNPADFQGWNPKPYYKAVKNYGLSNEKYFLFEEKLETAGNVQLFVYLNKGLPNRIAYFRKPLMTVYKQTKNKLKGYVAVFICEDDKGNSILKKMENPAHNEWKIENYKEKGKPHKSARKIKNEISDFINNKLDELSGINTSSKLTIEGLEEYLSIPGELLENEDELDYRGENTNTKSGENTNEVASEETGSMTTTQTPVKIQPNKKPVSEIKTEINGEFGDKGENVTILEGGGENEQSGGNKPGNEGDNPNNNSIETGDKPIKTPLSIKYRVIASQNKHFIIIESRYPVNNAEIEFFVGSDNGIDTIKIRNSSLGNVNKNKIENVYLNSGKNTLEIDFEDGISHTLKIRAYELQ